MAVNVFDVSKYILTKLGCIPCMKLQSLVYYCQAWSLVWDDAPLFNEPIEAKINGVICPKLYEVHVGQFDISDILNADISKLNDTQKETIDSVLKFYGHRKSKWLKDLICMELPWENAYNFDDSIAIINLDDMKQYYASISTKK